ncbi:hypothetical protein OI25_8242 (plasmid) [Paraburkholderia fungorum]|jgi:hypothetical protein|uniref:Transposase n=1 Tax=Paraburkholderia fungorum TaxID=134537 RepID=A0AAW3V5R5_9BURK|nr:hypothetical protein OI25_8242 [Paraburkholderia fungorum]MBB4516545.1 hypothetical protein [Paraburkholderia fungorum]MBB5545197.1 hypothetical protein [Paraburkholderia fungorum]MBB6204982.1 hypothetical protein [Paraburkholderia fungorum]PRZ52542.1 hypothetical protein BX589_114218 [Paraburkholderia fungorum]
MTGWTRMLDRQKHTLAAWANQRGQTTWPAAIMPG